MNIQIHRFTVAFAIAGSLAVAGTAKLSAAPINGSSIKAAVPAVTTEVRYRGRRDHPNPSYYNSYNSYSGYPTYDSYPGYSAYNSYWGYPTYNSYWGYPAYNYSYPGYWINAYGWY